SCCDGYTLERIVPFDAFSTDAAHSSSAFCSGCDGGTQCEIFRSKRCSCACSAGEVAASSAAAASAAMPTPIRSVLLIGLLLVSTDLRQASLAGYQRALALAHRPEGLVGGHRRERLEVVPLLLRLRRRLHLEQVHRVQLSSVLANAALAEQRIV